MMRRRQLCKKLRKDVSGRGGKDTGLSEITCGETVSRTDYEGIGEEEELGKGKEAAGQMRGNPKKVVSRGQEGKVYPKKLFATEQLDRSG